MMDKRLTIWTDKGAALDLGNPQSDAEAREILKQQFKLACNKLATFEDALENGTLVFVEPKVSKYKKGDTVWMIARDSCPPFMRLYIPVRIGDVHIGKKQTTYRLNFPREVRRFRISTRVPEERLFPTEDAAYERLRNMED